MRRRNCVENHAHLAGRVLVTHPPHAPPPPPPSPPPPGPLSPSDSGAMEEVRPHLSAERRRVKGREKAFARHPCDPPCAACLTVAVRSCDYGSGAVLLCEGGAGEEAPRLHLDCISAVPRLCPSAVPRLYLGCVPRLYLYLDCTAAVPRLYLGCTSAASRRHLGASRRRLTFAAPCSTSWPAASR